MADEKLTNEEEEFDATVEGMTDAAADVVDDASAAVLDELVDAPAEETVAALAEDAAADEAQFLFMQIAARHTTVSHRIQCCRKALPARRRTGIQNPHARMKPRNMHRSSRRTILHIKEPLLVPRQSDHPAPRQFEAAGQLGIALYRYIREIRVRQIIHFHHPQAIELDT